MASPVIVGVLRELLAAEQKSIAPRLMESTIFVARPELREYEAVRRAARTTRDNERRLAELMLSMGGAPGPRAADASTGDLHFLEVHFVIPRLAADREALIRKYESAAGRVAKEPRAAALISELLERHRSELAELRRMTGTTRLAG